MRATDFLLFQEIIRNQFYDFYGTCFVGEKFYIILDSLLIAYKESRCVFEKMVNTLSDITKIYLFMLIL